MKRLSYIFLLLFLFVFGAESLAQFGGGGGGISQPPPTPPSPSASTNNCGNKTLTRSNPPSGQVYYWQTTYNGTSTSNSSSTWSVSGSGTYYLRSRANSSGLWSHASNVSVTVNGYPSTPSTPSVSSNTCGNKTLTRGNPPSGVTWYWQGTNSNGYSTSNSSSTYTVSSSGTYYIRARTSAGCWSGSRAVGVTVNGYPSTPSTPSVSSNTCGNKTLTRGNPPSGVTWYWQGTNSNGYSTSNSSSTYAVSSSGTYYIRARTSAGCWSGSRAVGVTVNGYPSTPSTPSVSTNTCGNKTLTRGNPPSGVTWYWQGTNSNGYSTSNSSSTYSVGSSGTYYIRARSSAGCWSSSRAVSATVNGYPSAPSTPSVSSNTCGNKTLTRGNPPSGVTWYWQGTNSNGYSTSNSSSTYSVGSSGTYYIRAQSSAGCWSSSQAISATVNGYPSTPSAPSVSSNTCGPKTLTRGTPPSSVTWYWQGTTSGGTSTSNAASTYNAPTSGTYYLRAQSSAGCWSGERAVSVTVNDNPVAPSIPTVSEGCSNITFTRGTPSDGSTWYWQGTDANGTLTTDGATTYTVTTSGTYYIRALSGAGCWSAATAVSAALLDTPAMPPAPSVQTNCGNVVLTHGATPAGETWYWQGTDADGTSTSDAATTYTATVDGDYYLRSLSDDGCWGATRATSVTVNVLPDTPLVPTVSSNACGDKMLTQGTPPSNVTWYWQGTDANGTSTADASATYTATTSGTYYIRAQSSSGCWSATSQSVSVTVIDMPALPSISSVTYGFNGANLQLNAPSVSETIYWQTLENGTDEILTSLNRQLEDARVYYARTKSDNGCWSDALNFTYEAAEPMNLNLITLSNTSVRLVWSGIGGNETGFRISRATEVDGSYSTITETGPTVTEYDDIGLQSSTDYFYRIQSLVGGQVSTGIQVASQSTSPNFTGDQMLVHTPVSNGNISAMKWKGANDDQETIYAFHYDGLNRLKNAQYAQLANSSYEKDRGYFSVPDITYDLNGNILSLTRQGMTYEEVPEIIDVLSYNYGSGLSRSNKLLAVGDTGTDDGFKNGDNAGDDYAYDANGNMVQDLNKGINSIEYNHLNLPSKVEFDSTNYIAYMYDAAGIKLQQHVVKADTAHKTTDYIGSFIYETNGQEARALTLIQHEEGRIVPKDTIWDYQYHLKDHLGNVRLTFSTTPESYTMVETFETGEENGWQDLHRSTNTNANTTPGGNEVELLQSGQTGAMIFIGVNRRDTVNLSVNANYENVPSGNSFLATSYNTLFTSFNNTYGASPEIGETVTNGEFNEALSGIDMTGKGDPTSAPRAFLNYIFFDKEMNYLNAGFKQISTAAQGIGVNETISINVPPIEQEGYVLAYLSNENQEAVNVHFDDFTVYHGKTNIVSTQDYYPFGLTFNEKGRTAATLNKFKFNGKELDENTNWYDYGLRQYDPELGIWHAIDPSADSYYSMSPYNYVFNNPLRLIDPDGADPDDVLNAANRYKGTFYQFGGKNPDSRLIGAFRRVSGTTMNLLVNAAESYKDMTNAQNWKGIAQLNRRLGLENGCSFGIDCSGLSAKAFNADPDKLMDDLTTGNAHDQMGQFAGAFEEGKGILHDNFNNVGTGDIVYRIASKGKKKGEAEHAMVATGEVVKDKKGNVSHIWTVQATSTGDEVKRKRVRVNGKRIHKIGHTYRTGDNVSTSYDLAGDQDRQKHFDNFTKNYQTTVKN